MTAPRDTSQDHGVIHLVGLMQGGASGYIGDMEADGQRQLVASTVLPIDCTTDEAALLALGFSFGEPTDDLFREATMPHGWTKVGSDHDMWSYIEDKHGVRRVAVFYKAAFYDRCAFMRLA